MRAIVLASAATLMLLTGCATERPSASTPTTAAVQPDGASTAQALATFATNSASSTSSPAAVAAQPTETVILRPVSSAGLPASGYRVAAEQDQLDCGSQPDPSPVTVSAQVAICFPTALYAMACWPARAANYALCFRDAWSHLLYQLPTGARFDTAAVTAPARPVPLALLLADGDHCNIRDGGAWTSPSQHPDWVGYYSCTKDGAVWASRQAGNSAGIDETTGSWSVRVGALSGAGSLSVQRVITAYFVGTAAS